MNWTWSSQKISNLREAWHYSSTL